MNTEPEAEQVSVDRADLLAAWHRMELALTDVNQAVGRAESALRFAKTAQLATIHAYDAFQQIMQETFDPPTRRTISTTERNTP